jgi:hypothetical protein
MKRIIEGKTYNTDTATLVADWDNGKFSNDFNYAYENLYITKKGQFFITGNGCFINGYLDGNEMCRDMLLLSEAAALKWCEYRSIEPDLISTYLKTEEG